ncbi:MAG: hypothetical protein QW334_04985, partial [Thermofilum sp.]
VFSEVFIVKCLGISSGTRDTGEGEPSEGTGESGGEEEAVHIATFTSEVTVLLRIDGAMATVEPSSPLHMVWRAGTTHIIETDCYVMLNEGTRAKIGITIDGDVEGVSIGEGMCVFTALRGSSAIAIIVEKVQRSLYIDISGVGAATVMAGNVSFELLQDATLWFDSGTEVQVSVDGYYGFLKFALDGEETTSKTIQVLMNAPHYVSATFKPTSPLVEIKSVDHYGFHVVFEGNGADEYCIHINLEGNGADGYVGMIGVSHAIDEL